MWISEKTNKHLLIPRDAILKNIVYEVIRECDKRNALVEKKFVICLVNLLSLNVRNGIDFNADFDRSSIEKFIDCALSYVIDLNNSPMSITLKMQVFFIDNFNDFEEIVSENMESLNRKTAGLVKEITETVIKGKEEIQVLQKKIIIDIILKMAIGNPSSIEVVNDTTNALNSVMTEKDFENYTTMNTENRQESLAEIRLIVCGIILFNKDNGVGNAIDENFPDLPKTLEKSYDSIESLLQFTLCDIMDRVNIISSAFDVSISIALDSPKLSLNLQQEIDDKEVEIMKDLLVLNRQHEIYVRKLLNNLKNLKYQIDKHVHNFHEKLLKLHEIVQFRSAVPSIQIFPKFKELAEMWLELHHITFVLTHISQMNNFLQHLSELARQQQYDEILYKMLDENPIETDVDRLKKTIHQKIQETDSSDVKILAKANAEIELLGFCSFIFAESKILMPSNPEIGVCLWKQQNFTFNSIKAAEHFIHKPQIYMNKIIDVIRNNVPLIMFFNIYDIIMATKDQNLDPLKSAAPLAKDSLEKEIQTDLHPVPQNIDKDYVWNLWHLRQKAIDLADLRQKKTSSAQTSITYQKTDINTQASDSRKDQNLQTKQHKKC